MHVARVLGGLALSLMFFLSAGTVRAQEFVAQAFVEGTHYEKLPVMVATADENKVEVIEVFSYACIHCFNFEPAIENWREALPENVEFSRLPAVFNADWELMAQAFYTAQTLGVGENVHMPIFEGIHVKREDMRKPDVLSRVFAEQADVSAEDFDTAYSSFSVRSRVEQAKAKVQAYRVTGVPSMIVNGKYRVDGRMAGSNTKMLEVVEHLVAMEAAAATDAGQ